MVRKIVSTCFVLVLIFAFGISAQAVNEDETEFIDEGVEFTDGEYIYEELLGEDVSTYALYSIYDGSISSSYVTYFKDILAGVPFNKNYVAFRSGQYTYTMVVGELEYNGNSLTLIGDGKEYIFTTSSGYNSYPTYNVYDITSFSLSLGDYLVYSDLGDYPQLMERGEKYEVFTAVLLCVALLCIVVGRFFRSR